MTIFDYLLNIGLISLVVLQMRGRALDRRGLVLPLVLVGWAASHYLHGIPTAGNDLPMVVAGTLIGVSLGTASGFLTRLSLRSDGVPIAKATGWAALLWVLGIGSRLGFSLYAQHAGQATIGRFSMAHHLTAAGWVTALVLMSFAEVISRTLLLWARSRNLTSLPTSALALG
jgi:hypothetical protein